MEEIVDLFGSNFTLTLEEYFTQLEFLAEAVKLAPAGGGLSSADLRAKRERLMGALAAVLEMSTDVGVRKGGGCQLHEQLVGELRAKDTVITFNYDCVLDHALRRHAPGKWSTRYGYTFPSDYTIENEDAWDADPPASASTKSVHVLKMHGSLNWQLSDGGGREIKMKRRLHRLNGIPKFTVIPPVWNKLAMDQDLFKILWKNAERAIRNARHIAVVGFSFTPTDLHVQSLFRVALAKSNLKTLVIANPSQEDRGNVRAVFAKALERSVIVRQYNDFEAFVSAYPECFS